MAMLVANLCQMILLPMKSQHFAIAMVAPLALGTTAALLHGPLGITTTRHLLCPMGKSTPPHDHAMTVAFGASDWTMACCTIVVLWGMAHVGSLCPWQQSQ